MSREKPLPTFFRCSTMRAFFPSLERPLSFVRLIQALGYLQGLVETIIKQERKNYEQTIKKGTTGGKA